MRDLQYQPPPCAARRRTSSADAADAGVLTMSAPPEMAHRLVRRVALALRPHLAPDAAPLVVAVSGGLDSLALLHILWTLRGLGWLVYPLHVATLDHATRGAASAADAAFVVETCARWEIAVTSGQLAPETPHDEASLRAARYAFFARVARQIGASTVVTAHHADDQAETLLLRLIRGTSVRGLAGMRPRLPLPAADAAGDAPLWVVRPLLGTTRADLAAYAAAHALEARDDASNHDPRYGRNRIRLHLLPTLRQYNPRIVRALAVLAQNAAEESAYLDEQVAAFQAGSGSSEGEQVSADRAAFAALHPALARRWLVWAAERLRPDGELSAERIGAAAAAGQRGRVGTVVELADGVRLSVDYTHVRLSAGAARPHEPLALLLPRPGLALLLDRTGRTRLDGGAISISAALPDGENAAAARLAFSPESEMVLRARQAGERFAPFGMGGQTQKVAAWMVDHKVPARVRDRVPLLVIDGVIAAIVWGRQWTISEHFAVRATTPASSVFYFLVHQP